MNEFDEVAGALLLVGVYLLLTGLTLAWGVILPVIGLLWCLGWLT